MWHQCLELGEEDINTPADVLPSFGIKIETFCCCYDCQHNYPDHISSYFVSYVPGDQTDHGPWQLAPPTNSRKVMIGSDFTYLRFLWVG